MKISALKEAVRLCRAGGVTPFIWGHRGLGKSQITEQTATDNKIGFSDMRLSQCEASDLRGLPLADRDNNVTRYLAPADLPVGGMSWTEYMTELNIEKVLGSNLTVAQISDIVHANPTILENPTEVIKILAAMGKFRAADEIARKRAVLMPRLDEGILFLDELNRAQDDVIQATFQLVLERRLGTYVLPSGWHVVCAGNYMEGYMTNGFTDPAFLDRFTHLILDGGELTLEEWVNYMSAKHGSAAATVIEFASQNCKHLDGDIKGELGFSIQPSRRSWEAVIRVEEVCKSASYSEDARMGVIAGLVGREAALSFTRYSCPVRPMDLINHGIEHFKPKLKTLNRNQMTGLCWGLVSFLKGKVDDDKLAKVAMDFAKFVAGDSNKDKDLAVAFCNLMVGGSNLKARAALVSNPAVARLIGKFRAPDAKKTFADRLNEDPTLQLLVSNAAWGEKSE